MGYETALILICDPEWIRTNDPQLRRLLLYPLSYGARKTKSLSPLL